MIMVKLDWICWDETYCHPPNALHNYHCLRVIEALNLLRFLGSVKRNTINKQSQEYFKTAE